MALQPDPVLVALQRFGLGARAGSRAALVGDPRGACLAEIGPGKALLPKGDLLDTPAAIQFLTALEDRQREKRTQARQVAQQEKAGRGEAMASATPAIMPTAMPDPDEVRVQDLVAAEVKARFAFGMEQPVGFAERWAQFWSNHFCVAIRRGSILRNGAGPYEREAIRPHVFGRFEDLLIAVETHPAMLHYLDQRQSIGPNSPAGRRQNKGLNENLAREILELHTLGVQGGYSQADVTAFARILTGWSITGREENIDGFGGFHFAANRHEPGAHVVLGKTYAEPGKERGLTVLRDLVRHPATGRFLATKLAKHFVADAPPASLIAKLSESFRKSEGDLAAVARTLLTAEEAWTAPLTKLRMPSEFLLASFRAFGWMPERPQQIANFLNLMGQPLWNPPGPNGHPDDEASLAAPKAIKTRMDIALQMSRPVAARLDPRELAVQIYGPSLSPETQQAIGRAENRAFGLALLLLSPEFQRR
ncbi:MAG: DUF1800 family protein [Methylobacterium sp.]|nr:DUF1800 family protein [Methylobacterium sp.]